jgi:hypothetical protein
VYGREEGNTFFCSYDVQLTATGEAGSEGVWSRVRFTLTTSKGGHTVRDTVSGGVLAEIVGTARIQPGQTLRAPLASGFRFPNNSLDNASEGAHSAEWEIQYVTGREVRSAFYRVVCREPLPPTGPPAGRYALVSIDGTLVPAWSRYYQVAADTLEFYADTTVSGREYQMNRDGGVYMSTTYRRKYRFLHRDTLAFQRSGGPDLAGLQQRYVRKSTSLVYEDNAGFATIRWRYDPVIPPADLPRLGRVTLLPLAPRAPTAAASSP